MNMIQMHFLQHYLSPLNSCKATQSWLRPFSYTNFEAANLASHELKSIQKNHLFLSSSSSWVVYGVEKESQHFEVDPEKAREALKNLDQQLQSLSEKKVRPPKIKASDVNISRDGGGEEVGEFSGSFLAYSAGALILLTIFYNVLFLTVIKPSIDGPDQPSLPTAAVEREIQK